MFLNITSSEDIGEDGLTLRVTCGKLTLSPSQCQSGELSENPENTIDLEILEERFKATEGRGTFSISLDDKLKDGGTENVYINEENVADQQKHNPCKILIQMVFFAIFAYFIFDQIFWVILCCNFQDDPAEQMDISDVIEGFVQLSRLSSIPLRQ